MIVLKNPDNGAEIKGFCVNRVNYFEDVGWKPGQSYAFEDSVAAIFQDHFGFLEVEPIVENKKTGKFKCPHCEFESEARIAVFGHMKAQHKDQPKVEPIVLSEANQLQAPVPSVKPATPLIQNTTVPAEEENIIPKGAGTDKDGIEWYGNGLEKDDVNSPE